VSGGRAFPIVIAAPSGAGKTSLAQELVLRHADVVFSVSATTRSPRAGERDGVDYHFVADAEFARLVEADELVEWAVVHGNRYGTIRREVEEANARGETVLLDIDVQGARQVRQRLPEAVLVFVLPPSGTELVRRLDARATEDSSHKVARLTAAAGELNALAEFDYVVVNDDFGRALAALEAIKDAEACRVSRQPDLRRTAVEMATELRQLVQRSR